MSVLHTEQGPRFPDGRPEDEQPAWRRDFPIDLPQDVFVARRDYTKFLVLTSFAFVIGQFWIVARSAMRRGRGRPPIAKVTRFDALPIGGALQFNYPGANDPCLLLRLDEDQLVAYGQKCTHLSCAVVPKLERGEIHCPCHVGSFDPETGRPIAGPPRRPLNRVVLEVRDGIIYATGVEERTV